MGRVGYVGEEREKVVRRTFVARELEDPLVDELAHVLDCRSPQLFLGSESLWLVAVYLQQYGNEYAHPFSPLKYTLAPWLLSTLLL